MDTLFILFETDIWMSKKSRIFVGVFTSRKLAEIQAEKNKINSTISRADIVEVEKNRFLEI
jgi:hypothetical protein